MSGRPGLPVTAWQPEAVSGYRGRPTLLSNAETFAQLAALVQLGASGYAALGLPDEPGTVLLTVSDGGGARVVEVATGTPWDAVLSVDQLDRPLCSGGYHGTWSAPGQLQGQRVSREGMRSAGLTLGAGVVVVPGRDECPVQVTAEIVAYLAGSTAGRCGPCFNGLPAMSITLEHLASRSGHVHDTARLLDLAGTVERRGACAHPDGTARLVRSLLTACADEVRPPRGRRLRVRPVSRRQRAAHPGRLACLSGPGAVRRAASGGHLPRRVGLPRGHART